MIEVQPRGSKPATPVHFTLGDMQDQQIGDMEKRK
jgi:hypothetical protein